MTNCTQESFEFPVCKRRRVEANFQGGNITSDGGVLLLQQIDRRLGLSDAGSRHPSSLNFNPVKDCKRSDSGIFGVKSPDFYPGPGCSLTRIQLHNDQDHARDTAKIGERAQYFYTGDI